MFRFWKKAKNRAPDISPVTLLVLSLIIAILVLRLFVFDVYVVSSSSMEPTLFHDDIVLIRRFHHSNRSNYQLQPSHSQNIHLNDILVFNYPYNYLSNNIASSSSTIYLVKRCIGLPGDTVITSTYSLDCGSYANNSTIVTKQKPNQSFDIFMKETLIVVVPIRGGSIDSLVAPRRIINNILDYERITYSISGGKIVLSSEDEFHYKNNYYFVIGENENGSIDSRNFGPIPEHSILGKAILVFHRKHAQNNAKLYFF